MRHQTRPQIDPLTQTYTNFLEKKIKETISNTKIDLNDLPKSFIGSHTLQELVKLRREEFTSLIYTRESKKFEEKLEKLSKSIQDEAFQHVEAKNPDSFERIPFEMWKKAILDQEKSPEIEVLTPKVPKESLTHSFLNDYFKFTQKEKFPALSSIKKDDDYSRGNQEKGDNDVEKNQAKMDIGGENEEKTKLSDSNLQNNDDGTLSDITDSTNDVFQEPSPKNGDYEGTLSDITDESTDDWEQKHPSSIHKMIKDRYSKSKIIMDAIKVEEEKYHAYVEGTHSMTHPTIVEGKRTIHLEHWVYRNVKERVLAKDGVICNFSTNFHKGGTSVMHLFELFCFSENELCKYSTDAPILVDGQLEFPLKITYEGDEYKSIISIDLHVVYIKFDETNEKMLDEESRIMIQAISSGYSKPGIKRYHVAKVHYLKGDTVYGFAPKRIFQNSPVLSLNSVADLVCLEFDREIDPELYASIKIPATKLSLDSQFVVPSWYARISKEDYFQMLKFFPREYYRVICDSSLNRESKLLAKKTSFIKIILGLETKNQFMDILKILIFGKNPSLEKKIKDCFSLNSGNILRVCVDYMNRFLRANEMCGCVQPGRFILSKDYDTLVKELCVTKFEFIDNTPLKETVEWLKDDNDVGRDISELWKEKYDMMKKQYEENEGAKKTPYFPVSNVTPKRSSGSEGVFDNRVFGLVSHSLSEALMNYVVSLVFEPNARLISSVMEKCGFVKWLENLDEVNFNKKMLSEDLIDFLGNVSEKNDDEEIVSFVCVKKNV